jgi:hypothetical protein
MNRLLPVIAMLVPCLVSVWAFGQTGASSPAQPPASAGGVVVPVELSDEPVVIEAVGLSVRVPRGAVLSTTLIDAATSVTVVDPASRWTVGLSAPRTDRLDVTVDDAIEKAITDVLSADLVKDQRTGEVMGSRGAILERVRELRVAGSPEPGQRVYVALPVPGGSGAAGGAGGGRVVRGLVFFKPLPERFVKFELTCNEADFPAARQVFELMVASLTLSDPKAVMSARQNAIQAGIAWLGRLTPADYDAAVKAGGDAAGQTTQYFRFFRPSPTGDQADAQERGFRTVRFFKGTRAEVEAGSPPQAEGPANPMGYLAEVKARLLNDARSGLSGSGGLEVIDVEGRYFVSVDRREETWAVTTAVWDGKAGRPVLFTETGTRTGPTMTVVVNAPGQPSKTIRPTLPPEGYITQVETFLLPRLLVRSGVEADLGLYAYQSSAETVSLRRDRLSKAGGDGASPEKDGAAWVLTTRPRESDRPQRYELDAQGLVVRGEPAEGMAMVPIEPEALMKLWERAGLPTGAINAEPERPRSLPPRGGAGSGRGSASQGRER